MDNNKSCTHSMFLTPETCSFCLGNNPTEVDGQAPKGEIKLPETTDKLKPELLVVKMCREAGLDLKKLNKGAFITPYRKFRDKMLSKLNAEYPKLTQKQIGDLLGVSQGAISQKTKKMKNNGALKASKM